MPSMMSTLEVLQSYPVKLVTFLSMIGDIDTSSQLVMKFDIVEVKLIFPIMYPSKLMLCMKSTSLEELSLAKVLQHAFCFLSCWK
jgi:hypothetical protein